MDGFLDLTKQVSLFDLIFFVITVLSLIKCYKKGFILSLLSASKWLLAYVITLFLFPKTKPFVEGVIDNEYVLDVALGVCLFIVVIFVILLINKGISKAVTYTYRFQKFGLGFLSLSLDILWRGFFMLE